jgi:hypothetical protein
VDLELLRLEISGTIHVNGDGEEILHRWHTELKALSWEGNTVEGEEPQDVVLARGRFVTINLEEVPADALDAEGDLAVFIPLCEEAVFNPEPLKLLGGRWCEFVFADRVEVPEAFRGHRLGLLLAAMALQELGRNRLAACYPSAYGVEDDERKAADRRNREVWRKFGFRHYKGGVCYLDTDTKVLSQNIAKYRKIIAAAALCQVPSV